MRTLLVIPAFNEGPTLQAVVDSAAPFADEVLVVDDGSVPPVVLQPGVRLVRHERNRGKGAALKTGIRFASNHGFSAVGFMDGDGQHDVNRLPSLWHALERFPVVVGSRCGDWDKKMPFLRRWTNRSMSALLGWFGGQPMPDSQCGFRALRTEVACALPIESDCFEAESEMLLQAAWRGLEIGWVPIPTIYASRPSHIHPLRDTIRFLRMLRRARANRPRA